MTAKFVYAADLVPGDMLTQSKLIIGIEHAESMVNVHVFSTTTGDVRMINCCSKEGLWSAQRFMDA